MNDEDNTFNGIRYKFGRMGAMKQFHVVRRLAPLVTRMGEVDFAAFIPAVAAADPEAGELDTAGVAKGLMSQLGKLQPIADAIAQLPDADSEYIINCCLEVVTREQGPAWVPIWNAKASRPQFDDIDMMLMINLSVRVVMENLSGFFPARASK